MDPSLVFLAMGVGAIVLGVVVMLVQSSRPPKPDRPGERTVATFVAPWYWDGLTPESPETVLVQRLWNALVERRIELTEPTCHRGLWKMSGRDAHLTMKVDDDLGGAWLLRVWNASWDGPGPIALARAADEVLGTFPEVTSLRWHRRGAPLNVNEGHEHPTGH